MNVRRICIILFLVITNLFISTTAQAAEGGVPVLLYHHILKKAENPYPDNGNIVSYEAFSEQMAYLNSQGYYTATLSELASYINGAITLPAKTVVITFDDGLKTNYLYAYPILKKYGFKAASFLITNRISETPVAFNPTEFQSLSWPEVNEMKDVFQYGSHTHGLHYQINGASALIAESDQVILQDLQTSRRLINTDFIAYPFGGFNNRVIGLLKQTGFKYAFTTASVNAVIGNNPYTIGRKSVYPSTSLAEFKALINTGASKAGWSKIGSKWYYFDANGVKKTGWIKLGATWYYLNQTGAMQTGWVKYGGFWYYLDQSGAMKTGWVKVSSKWYNLNPSGAMQTGWLNSGGTWYYLEPSGSMRTGWTIVKNKWYYFYPDGSMAANTVIDGYQVGEDGVWIQS